MSLLSCSIAWVSSSNIFASEAVASEAGICGLFSRRFDSLMAAEKVMGNPFRFELRNSDSNLIGFPARSSIAQDATETVAGGI